MVGAVIRGGATCCAATRGAVTRGVATLGMVTCCGEMPGEIGLLVF